MRDSKIEWTDHTFNPWIGCQRVSPGCVHCYAEARDHHWRPGRERWGPTAERTRTSPSYWKQLKKWDAEAKAAGTRPRVFCASLADVFEDRAELAPWRAHLFAHIVECRHLDFLLLTKRPENLAAMWPYGRHPAGMPLSNVWLGTTVEDQQRADERIHQLLSAPAVVHFLSVEPLLGPVDLAAAGAFTPGRWGPVRWVICGGESGHGARSFDVEWARSLRDQCAAAGATFFMKQLGVHTRMSPDGGDPLPMFFRKGEAGDLATFPADLRVREFPEVRHG